MHPSFPADELEKYKKRELGELEDEMSRPDFLANKEFHKSLYGDTNYAVTAATPAQIQGVTSEMLAEYHHKYYVPGNAVLGIVGDVNTDDVMKMVEKYFGEWPKTAPARGEVGSGAAAATQESCACRPAGIGSDEYRCWKFGHQAE